MCQELFYYFKILAYLYSKQFYEYNTINYPHFAKEETEAQRD